MEGGSCGEIAHGDHILCAQQLRRPIAAELLPWVLRRDRAESLSVPAACETRKRMLARGTRATRCLSTGASIRSKVVAGEGDGWLVDIIFDDAQDEADKSRLERRHCELLPRRHVRRLRVWGWHVSTPVCESRGRPWKERDIRRCRTCVGS